MSLTSLFNFNYLKENIKKSKAIILLCMLLLPTIGGIILLVKCSQGSNFMPSIYEVSGPVLFGMYLVPVILSITLFSFIYKRGSIDFTLSMPINKKQIFLTNTFGGIIIILLMQIINLIITLAISLIYSNMIIDYKMLFDIFLIYSISYIFVFTSCNIAASVSSNKITTIVVTLLILFLVPFVSTFIKTDGFNYNNYGTARIECLNKECTPVIYECDSLKCKNDKRNNIYTGYVNRVSDNNYTMPYKLIAGVFLGEEFDSGINVSLLKMVFLSIVYIAVGLILFIKKKFEIVGTSFRSERVHILVRTLTTVPVACILYVIIKNLGLSSHDFFTIILLLVLIFTYLIIYDLITRKRVTNFFKMAICLVIVSSAVCIVGAFFDDKEEFERIKKAAAKIQNDSDVLLVVGIGGSYLGARAAIEFLSHSFYNVLPKSVRKTPEIYFVGNSISSKYIHDLKQVLEGKDFSINIISKSGTTTEPAIAFRVFKEMLIEKYGKEEANKRIYATTDKAKGALKNLADEEGYEEFVVPDDVGGRFSVLTAVGLLPIAVSGADIDKLMEGAASGRKKALETPYESNPALLYAAVRNILLRKGKSVEIVANYEPSLHYVSEWWKQLYGESEGKDQRGIFPAAVDLTTDLHSMGQFIQDGARIMFETVINVEESPEEILLNKEDVDTDGMNYLAGKSVDFVNKSAMNGTILAHTDGNVPNLMVKVPEQNAFYLGELFYFFEFACGVSGYILGINPFNQPGVESYKKNMFALLGKPGYEEQREELLKRL